MQAYQKREDLERVLKFLLCAALGLLTGRLIGYPGTPTIAVSAILMLYIDRGYLGSLRYSWRRIQVQVLMGALVFALIWVLRRVLPVENWIIGILTAVIAIGIGLPIQYRHPIAPLTVTLGNAVLIMTTGILGNPKFYPERVLFCILGAIIAHLVNFLIFPQLDRYATVCTLLRSDAEALLGAVRRPEPGAVAPGLAGSPALLEKHIGHLREDHRWRRRTADPWRRELAAGLLAAERSLLALSQSAAQWGPTLSEDFRTWYQGCLDQAEPVHRALLGALDSHVPPAPAVPAAAPLTVSDPGEILLAAAMLCYLEVLGSAVK